MNIREISELEKEYYKKLEEIKKELIKLVNDTTYPESTIIGKNMTVISSALLKESWSPSYHIPGSQSKETEKKIEKAVSVSDIERILNQLISDKKINKEKLNQNIIKKLLEIKKLF